MIKRPMLAVQSIHERLHPDSNFFITGFMAEHERNLQKITFLENGKYYFISSELSEIDGKRYFTVRCMGKDGIVDNIGPYCEMILTKARTFLAKHLGVRVKDLK